MNRSWIMRGAPGRWMLALGFFTVASVVLIIPLIVGVLWSLVDPDAGWFPPAAGAGPGAGWGPVVDLAFFLQPATRTSIRASSSSFRMATPLPV